MTSTMNITDFTKKITENTQQGSLDYRATPFMILSNLGSYNKEFYGKIKKNEFELTGNSFVKSIPYYISGEFEHNNEGSTNVTYKIKANWWAVLCTRIIPIAYIIGSSLFIINSWADSTGILIMCAMFISFTMVIRFVWMRQIKRFEKKFRELLLIN